MTDRAIAADDSQVAGTSLRALKSLLERLPVKKKAG